MPGSQAGCIPRGEPQPNCICIQSYQLLHKVPYYLYPMGDHCKQATNEHLAPGNRKLQAARCFPPELRGHSAFCVPADRMLPIFPSAWKAGQYCQTTTHQPGKTRGHDRSGRANGTLAASCTTQPLTRVVNFCTLPPTAGKTKPKDSPYLSATWFN